MRLSDSLIDIVDKRVCTQAEIHKLILYLSGTPVRWIVDEIIGGTEVLKVYIVKRSELGAAARAGVSLRDISIDHH